MKILILSSEVWNDKINGNNVTSNWFEGMNAEFANIYGSPGEPYNTCCSKYFQITDAMMAKSIIGGKKAGKRLFIDSHCDSDSDASKAEEEPQKLYRFLKSISGDFLRFVRELIWVWGKYDIEEIKRFIDDFNPDIIFTERMASCKMLRMEKIVSKLTDAPIVAFTGDDEYSLRQLDFSPFYWINRFMVRRGLREMVKKYSIYYTLSEEQAEDYRQRFGCRMEILQKCGELETTEYKERPVNSPVRMIYAGKLYMKRWKPLFEIAEVVKEINRSGAKIVLEIYTKDKITKKQDKILNDRTNTFIKGPVPQEELRRIYKESDVALHVESLQLRQRLLTRLSFSTKIIDALFSGCAVLAYCWSEQSGWRYLKREDAAICVDSKDELERALHRIAEDKEYISEYARKAFECCKRNHQKKAVQEKLLNDFKEVSRLSMDGTGGIKKYRG